MTQRPSYVPPWSRIGKMERVVVKAVEKMLDALDSDEMSDLLETLMVKQPSDLDEINDDVWAEEFNDLFDKVAKRACQALYRGIIGEQDKLYYYAIEDQENRDDPDES